VASSRTKAAVPYRKLWIGATNLRMDKKREGKEPSEKERERVVLNSSPRFIKCNNS
jgi:hypothetical protein